MEYLHRAESLENSSSHQVLQINSDCLSRLRGRDFQVITKKHRSFFISTGAPCFGITSTTNAWHLYVRYCTLNFKYHLSTEIAPKILR